jgi:hypothetical protein
MKGIKFMKRIDAKIEEGQDGCPKPRPVFAGGTGRGEGIGVEV